MQALNRFEPEKGFRFATYAMWWIRACIQDYILRSWSLVKIGTTTNQKKLFFKLRSAKNKIAALESGDLHPDQVASIAKSLDVSDQDVVDMNRRLGGDKSINAPIQHDGEAGEWQDYLVDQSPSPEAIVVEQDETEHQRSALIAAVDVLDGRERDIFEARLLADEPQTLEELAIKFNVSRERIRQIEARAFEKVRKAARPAPHKRRRRCWRLWTPEPRSDHTKIALKIPRKLMGRIAPICGASYAAGPFKQGRFSDLESPTREGPSRTGVDL